VGGSTARLSHESSLEIPPALPDMRERGETILHFRKQDPRQEQTGTACRTLVSRCRQPSQRSAQAGAADCQL